jgi:hypothetical protein
LTPIPPLVASPTIPADALRRLRQGLITQPPAPKVAAIFDALLLKGFAHVEAREYDRLL